ncbi:MAG TPA: hypothetical protein VK734_01900 [Bradyrhizobium sp.]|jgi:hypothetical protein|nr:hypothetical protein [Bradyrhizobium sp.]
MRASMAYFAGAGTIVVAIAAGLGGGLVIANVMNPHGVRDLSKVELQTKSRQANAAQPSPQPSSSPAIAWNASQEPAPYLAQVQPAAKVPVVVGAAPSRPQENLQDQPQPTSDAANATQTPSRPATHDEASAPENAYAKARDADLKRQDDKRKSDRHQQWAARHQQQRDPDMRDVEEQVRRASGSREVIVRRDDSDHRDYDRRDDDRPDYGRPTGFGFPHLNFFGPDD